MYAEIASNKRKTWVLVTLFSIVIILLATVVGIYIGAEPEVSLIFGAAFSILYSFVAFFVADKTVLFTEGAKRLDKSIAPDVYRIVENLAITNGIPMPTVYLINDDAPNAFATGRNPEHASIALTTGLLRTLDKAELEGVIAHELGHIKNFDIRLMTMVVVMAGLLVLLADILIRLPFHRGRDNRTSGQLGIILLVAGIILGILSPIIAQVIKLAVSRSREYLADATGALTTRHPEGLARALEKIRDYDKPMERANHATAHLYISSPFGATQKATSSWYNRLFSTHPPINDRIAKLRNINK